MAIDLESVRDDRRNQFLAECDGIRRVWNRRIAGRSGPLPGATLDPLITTRGWVGHVQVPLECVEVLSSGREMLVLADKIADAYDLPTGAVLVEPGYRGVNDTACVWAYQRPGEVDYHERLPHTVFGKDWAGETTPPGQLTRLERDELKSWAQKHADMLKYFRAGHYTEMEQFVRRLNRLRAAILDALTRATPDEVREMVTGAGLVYEDLPEDIADRLEMTRTQRWS